VDIGGGTTEIAVISLAGIVFSKSIRIGGDECDEAITNHLKKTYNLMIGERTAEEVKIKIGSSYPMEEEGTMEVKGRDILAGLPKYPDGTPLIPAIMISGHGDIESAVQAMKAGASDFLQKPFRAQVLLDSVQRCIEKDAQARQQAKLSAEIQSRIKTLTRREFQVLELLIDGKSNKEIARQFDLSPRTVEKYRFKLMEKMQADSVGKLVQMAVACGIGPT